MKSERGEIAGVQITTCEFEKSLLEICNAQIAAYPQNWTQENPLYSTCVPVSLIAQRIFGGKLLRADLSPFPEFRHMRYHWVNLLTNGKLKDFTKPQFGTNYPEDMLFLEKPMSTILKIPGAIERSEILYSRLIDKLQSLRV